MSMEVGTRLFPHLPMLEKAGIKDDVMQLLHRDWWQHLFFGINEPTFKEITREVLSSFKASKTLNNIFIPAVKFRAFGESHEISLFDIFKHLGFETLDDTDHDHASLLDLPPKVNRQELWASNTPGGTEYKPQTSPSTALHPYKYRVINTLLSSIISGRAEASGKVTTIDFLFLYCMVHERRPEMGALFAGLFLRQATYWVKAIFADPFITRND